MVCEYFLPFKKLPFYFAHSLFLCAKLFILMFHLFVFAFVACTFGVMSKNNICEDQCQGAFPCALLHSFIMYTIYSTTHSTNILRVLHMQGIWGVQFLTSWILQTRDLVTGSGIFSFMWYVSTWYVSGVLPSVLLENPCICPYTELLYLSVIPPNPKELPDGWN